MEPTFQELTGELTSILKDLNNKPQSRYVPLVGVQDYNKMLNLDYNKVDRSFSNMSHLIIVDKNDSDSTKKADAIIAGFKARIDSTYNKEELTKAYDAVMAAFKTYKCTAGTAETLFRDINNAFIDKISELETTVNTLRKLSEADVAASVSASDDNKSRKIIDSYNTLRLKNLKDKVSDIYRLVTERYMIEDCGFESFNYAITGMGDGNVTCPYIIWTGTKAEFIILIRLILDINQTEKFKSVACIFRQDEKRELHGRNACVIVKDDLWNKILKNADYLYNAAVCLANSTKIGDAKSRGNSITDFYIAIKEKYPEIARLVIKRTPDGVIERKEKESLLNS